MPLSPHAHLALIEREMALLAAHPLSVRQGRLVAALLDVMPDRAYSADHTDPTLVLHAGDRADYRRTILSRSPAMALLAALAGERARLGVSAQHVPAEHVDALAVGDFMVSLYNNQTVPRLMIERDGAPPISALEVFAAAVAFWEELLDAERSR